MLIDTHAHLYWESFKIDFDQTIKRALEAGVTMIINVGVDPNLSQLALKQVQNQLSPIFGLSAYSTIGIHPHEANKYSTRTDESIHEDINKLSGVYQSSPSQVVAVGECGLDFFFDNNPDFVTPTPPVILGSTGSKSGVNSATPESNVDAGQASMTVEQQKELQRKLFQAQIELAKKLNLPLIVHCRDDRSKNPENSEAWDECLTMIGDHPTILHCYSGLPSTTNHLPPTCLVSFAATITYPKNEYLREAAKILPLEKIVLETDCPFLPSQQNRGKRNEPATVREIADLIADLKGISFEEVDDKAAEAEIDQILSNLKFTN